MAFNLTTFETQLRTALNLFDRKTAAALCDEFIQFLYESHEEVPVQTLEHVLQILRNKRMFLLMQQLCECYLQLGRQTYEIRRQYAQSLLDQGIYAAALTILQQLKSETGSDSAASAAGEYAQAVGLIGRIYKQQYINAHRPSDPRMVELLHQAIQSYQDAYTRDPGRLWPGINLVALLHRARVDHADLPANLPADSMPLPDPTPIAEDILSRIEALDRQHSATGFDFAIALETCIALARPDQALAWADKYVNSAAADAFEIASTLRQFREVWQLTMDIPMGQQILPLLSAALLRREGATLTISTAELGKQKALGDAGLANLKQTLSTDSFKTYEWYLRGLKACSAVARIGQDTATGKGTGFLLNGELLSKNLKGKIVLLTNAHIVSLDPIGNNGSLQADEAVATLEAVGHDQPLKFKKVIRTSSIFELDTTVLTFDAAAQKKLKALKDHIYPYTLAGAPPTPDGKQRVYIIGHPRGGVLQISLQDNVFLSCNDQRMHYRTPTAPGNSGSPVFNDRWEIIGIHHAGGNNMRKLDDPRQLEAANEGIRIDAIQKLFS